MPAPKAWSQLSFLEVFSFSSHEGGLLDEGVWGRAALCAQAFAQQQASPSLGGTVETTSSGSAPQGGQAGQRDPADRVISSPPVPVFSYWCRGLHLLPLGAATALVRRKTRFLW